MKISSQIKKVEITLEANDQFKVDTQIYGEKEPPFLTAGRTEQGGDRLVIHLGDIHLFNLKQEIEKHFFRKSGG